MPLGAPFISKTKKSTSLGWYKAADGNRMTNRDPSLSSAVAQLYAPDCGLAHASRRYIDEPCGISPSCQKRPGEKTINAVQLACLSLIAELAVSGCQTAQSRQDQLAAICADTNNRQLGNFHYDECQTIYPSTSKQRQRNYELNAPTGEC